MDGSHKMHWRRDERIGQGMQGFRLGIIILGIGPLPGIWILMRDAPMFGGILIRALDMVLQKIRNGQMCDLRTVLKSK